MNTPQIMPAVLEQDADAWALRINARWRQSRENIIETGQLLIDAKKALPHGSFENELEARLDFSPSVAQRLMAIARDPRLTNPAHVQLLPQNWGTLYELTKLSDEQFEQGIERKIISAEMERKDVELIRPTPHRESQERTEESQSESNQRQNGDGTEGAHADGVVSRPDAGRSASATSEIMDVTAGETAPNSAAPMPGGGLAIAHNRVEPGDGLDFFPTPPWATRALIEHVFAHLGRKGHCKLQTVWEPACGEGHMAAPLLEYFRDVFASDVIDYGRENNIYDFLTTDRIPGAGKFDWIITNPPFNDSADFVLKALELAGTGVAMFVRLAWLESVGRYEKIFRDHPPTQLAIFTERVPLHKGRWEEDGATMTAYIWLVWIKGAEPRAPFWIPPGCREALTKPGDGKRHAARAPEPETPATPETTVDEEEAAA